MGAAALSQCLAVMADQEWEPEEVFQHRIMARALEGPGPKLVLTISSSSTSNSLGSTLSLFPPSEQITGLWVEKLEFVKGWAPLKWRHERAESQAPPAPMSSAMKTQSKSKGLPERYWHAWVVSENQKGETRGQWCMLQVASAPVDRTMENANLDIKDAKMLGEHAQKFNMHLLRNGGNEGAGSGEPLPGVMVCVPVACKVVQSPAQQVFGSGDVVTLLPYACAEVTKFVFDGTETFSEIPHAFFHYIAWSTKGRDCIGDIQGNEEDDGSFILLNPSVPRWPGLANGSFLTSSMTGTQMDQKASAPTPTPEMFDKLHPKCGPLCKTFDAERSGKPARKHCGLPISCHVGGGY